MENQSQGDLSYFRYPYPIVTISCSQSHIVFIVLGAFIIDHYAPERTLEKAYIMFLMMRAWEVIYQTTISTLKY